MIRTTPLSVSVERAGNRGTPRGMAEGERGGVARMGVMTEVAAAAAGAVGSG